MQTGPRKRENIEKITWIGLAATAALSVIKRVIGWFGSIQAAADALHSFSGTASNPVIQFRVRYWTVPPDECRPYGSPEHRRRKIRE